MSPLSAVFWLSSLFLQLALALDLSVHGPFASGDIAKLSWQGVPPFNFLILASQSSLEAQSIIESFEGITVTSATWAIDLPVHSYVTFIIRDSAGERAYTTFSVEPAPGDVASSLPTASDPSVAHQSVSPSFHFNPNFNPSSASIRLPSSNVPLPLSSSDEHVFLDSPLVSTTEQVPPLIKKRTWENSTTAPPAQPSNPVPAIPSFQSFTAPVPYQVVTMTTTVYVVPSGLGSVVPVTSTVWNGPSPVAVPAPPVSSAAAPPPSGAPQSTTFAPPLPTIPSFLSLSGSVPFLSPQLTPTNPQPVVASSGVVGSGQASPTIGISVTGFQTSGTVIIPIVGASTATPKPTTTSRTSVVLVPSSTSTGVGIGVGGTTEANTKKSSNVGAIVGGTLAGIIGLIILILLLLCCLKRRRRDRRESMHHGDTEKFGVGVGAGAVGAGRYSGASSGDRGRSGRFSGFVGSMFGGRRRSQSSSSSSSSSSSTSSDDLDRRHHNEKFAAGAGGVGVGVGGRRNKRMTKPDVPSSTWSRISSAFNVSRTNLSRKPSISFNLQALNLSRLRSQSSKNKDHHGKAEAGMNYDLNHGTPMGTPYVGPGQAGIGSGYGQYTGNYGQAHTTPSGYFPPTATSGSTNVGAVPQGRAHGSPNSISSAFQTVGGFTVERIPKTPHPAKTAPAPTHYQQVDRYEQPGVGIIVGTGGSSSGHGHYKQSTSHGHSVSHSHSHSHSHSNSQSHSHSQRSHDQIQGQYGYNAGYDQRQHAPPPPGSSSHGHGPQGHGHTQVQYGVGVTGQWKTTRSQEDANLPQYGYGYGSGEAYAPGYEKGGYGQVVEKTKVVEKERVAGGFSQKERFVGGFTVEEDLHGAGPSGGAAGVKVIKQKKEKKIKEKHEHKHDHEHEHKHKHKHEHTLELKDKKKKHKSTSSTSSSSSSSSSGSSSSSSSSSSGSSSSSSSDSDSDHDHKGQKKLKNKQPHSHSSSSSGDTVAAQKAQSSSHNHSHGHANPVAGTHTTRAVTETTTTTVQGQFMTTGNVRAYNATVTYDDPEAVAAALTQAQNGTKSALSPRVVATSTQGRVLVQPTVPAPLSSQTAKQPASSWGALREDGRYPRIAVGNNASEAGTVTRQLYPIPPRHPSLHNKSAANQQRSQPQQKHVFPSSGNGEATVDAKIRDIHNQRHLKRSLSRDESGRQYHYQKDLASAPVSNFSRPTKLSTSSSSTEVSQASGSTLSSTSTSLFASSVAGSEVTAVSSAALDDPFHNIHSILGKKPYSKPLSPIDSAPSSPDPNDRPVMQNPTQNRSAIESWGMAPSFNQHYNEVAPENRRNSRYFSSSTDESGRRVSDITPADDDWVALQNQMSWAESGDRSSHILPSDNSNPTPGSGAHR